MRSSMSRRRNRSGYLGGAVKLALALLLLAIAGEWGAGFALHHSHDGLQGYTLSLSDDDLQKIYDTDNPGHYRDVLAESRLASKKVYSPLVEYGMAPREGAFFKITGDGYRSIGRPQDLKDSGPKVFVFGGSTVLGLGVANDETIPAFLDSALHAAGKAEVQVFNFGAESWYSTQERIQLEKLLTSGIKPDLAVFVDGGEEFSNCELPDRTAWSEHLGAATGAHKSFPLERDLTARSNLIGLVRQWRGEKIGDQGNTCRTDADVEGVIARLDTNRRMIEGMADKLGFKVLFATQPVSAYSYDASKRPVPFKNTLEGQSESLKLGYTRMAEIQAGGKALAGNYLWLAELELTTGNAYIDDVHYTPRMNQAIAGALAKFIGDKGLLP